MSSKTHKGLGKEQLSTVVCNHMKAWEKKHPKSLPELWQYHRAEYIASIAVVLWRRAGEGDRILAVDYAERYIE